MNTSARAYGPPQNNGEDSFWHYHNVGGTGAEVFRVRYGNPSDTGAAWDEVRAAKRLLQAAPILLAALREALNHEDGSPTKPYAIMVDDMRAAIAATEAPVDER